MTSAFRLAGQNLATSRLNQKLQHDQKIRQDDFNVGDQILVERKTVAKGRSAKLEDLYDGPYPIKSINFPQFIVQLPNGKTRPVQLRYIRKYYPRK